MALADFNSPNTIRSYAATKLPLLILAATSVLQFACASGNVLARAQSVELSTVSHAPRADFGKLPLAFEVNLGQTDPQVRFLSRGNGYSLFLTGEGAVLSLYATSTHGIHDGRTSTNNTNSDTVRLQLSGAKKDMRVSGEDMLPGTANYFIGNDPAKWHSAVPTFKRVCYSNVYPGIDLVYYGRQNRLEYDFVVAPKADAQAIRLQLDGARTLKLDASGNLQVIAAHGQIAFDRPDVYQVDADGRRVTVDGHFVLHAGNTLAFALGAYDHTRPLVIDPTLSYSTYLGGSTGSSATGVAVDASGDTYLTGETLDADFPTTGGVFQTNTKSKAGVASVFVSKLNAAGTALAFSTYIGGSGDGSGDGDIGYAIAVDAGGNSYITGLTFSSDFPLKNPYQSVNKGASNKLSTPFVTKLNATGTALVYSTYLGGSGYIYSVDRGDEGLGISVDPAGEAFITGGTDSADFPVTSGAYQTTAPIICPPGYLCGPSGVAFVSKLNTGGNALLYSTFLGGHGILTYTTPGFAYTHGDAARGIALDSSGNVYVTGLASSIDFPTTSGVFQPQNNGAANKASNAFITKLDPTLSTLVYSTYLGGSSTATPLLDSNTCFKCDHGDGAASIVVDPSGDAYVAGGTYSKDFPVTSGAFQAANKGVANAFVSKINPNATALLYSTLIGGSGSIGDVAYAMALDVSGDAYLSGFTSSADFPVTSDALQSTNKAAAHNAQNAFLTEVNPQATKLIYSTYFGGSGYQVPGSSPATYTGEISFGLALDCVGNISIVGYASSPDLPASAGLYPTKGAAATTAFAAKFAGTTGSTCTSTTKINTSTTVSANINPQVLGANVIYSAYVQPTTGSGIPTGTVTFTIDGTAGAPISVDSTGHATYSTITLSAGPHSVIATYSGDANYSTSGSGTYTETILGPAASIIVVSGSPQSTVYGTPFAAPLVALVRDANGNPIAGVSVSFAGAGLAFSSGMVTTGPNGQVAVTVSPTAAGSFSAAASVSGVVTPAVFALSASKVTLTITASNATVVYGQPIPSFLYVVAGFVNSDTTSILSGTPSETTTATVGSLPGSYPINVAAGTLTAANYSFLFVNGTLLITTAGTVATPTFSPPSGTYTSAQSITISDSTPGATIYYTVDGSVPSASSPKYTGTITANSSQTITAFATATGFSNSLYAAAGYIINLPVPVFTLGVTPSSATVHAGQAASFIVSVTPQNGFTQAVALSCSNLPAGAACTFSPASVSPAGASGTSSLTVTTSAALAQSDKFLIWTYGPGVASLALLLFPFWRRRSFRLVLSILVTAILLSTVACFNISSTMNTIIVTAQGGNTTQTVPISLTIQR